MIEKLTAILLAVLIVNPLCCCAYEESDAEPKCCCAQKGMSNQETSDAPTPEPDDSPCDCCVKGAKSFLETKITFTGNGWTLVEPCPCGEFVYTLPSWDHASKAEVPLRVILFDPPHYQEHCVYRL